MISRLADSAEWDIIMKGTFWVWPMDPDPITGKMGQWPGPPTKEMLRKEILLVAGGAAAELIGEGLDVDARPDLVYWYFLLQSQLDGGAGEDLYQIMRAAWLLRANFPRPDKLEEYSDLGRGHRQFLDRLFRKAISLVRDHWPKVECLANTLKDGGKLKLDEVVRLWKAAGCLTRDEWEECRRMRGQVLERHG
jgi:hypothetical protein